MDARWNRSICFGLFLIAAFAFLLICNNAAADTHVWDGGGADNKASTGANWDLDTAPIDSDSVVFSTGKNCTFDIVAAFNFQITADYPGIVTINPASGEVISNVMNNAGTINVAAGKWLRQLTYWGGSWTNNGIVTGAGSLRFVMYDADASILPGNISCNVNVYGHASSTANRVLTLLGDGINTWASFNILSAHATRTITLNTASYDFTSISVVVGARGGIVNLVASNSVITCGSFDSSDPTSSFIGTNVQLVITDSGTLKLKTTDYLDNILCQSIILNLTGVANVTEELTFIGLTASHIHGLYINGIRTNSVTTDANGSYSLGAGVFAWDNATLKITPVISIDGWERTDGGYRNVVWEGYDYWADHDADAVVSWTLSGTSWLSTDANGNITGEAGDDGTYYYKLTATAANGEVANVSGFIIVENSINEGLDTAFSWLAPLIGLVAIGFLAVALSSLSGSWMKKN